MRLYSGLRGVNRLNADRTDLELRCFCYWVVAGTGEDVHRHIAEAETGEDRSTR